MRIDAWLGDIIDIYYVELMCLLPVTLMLAGLACAVAADSYIHKSQKRTMLALCALVLSLIAQNYVENLLWVGTPNVPLRRVVAAYGYAVRPGILLLFLRVIEPQKKHIWGWALVGVNAALYAVSIFVPICFRIDKDNCFGGGIFPFVHTCTAVSLILLAALLVRTLRMLRPPRGREAALPVMATALIPLSLVLDDNVGHLSQPVSFLTVAVVVDCVLYYNWLHLRFVRQHEQALSVGQRAQLMLSQIKPHFLYNVLNMTEELCDTSPETAKEAINKFAQYLRTNMDSIDQAGAIPFGKKLNHTRLYVEIE